MTVAAIHSTTLPATGVAPVIGAVGVSKWIDERPVLRGIDLRVEAGAFVVLLGANGAGKSTLLKVLATLTPADEGTLELFGQSTGRDAAALRARIGLIGHQAMLYRDLTARENLEFFGKLYGVKRPGERAEQLLETVGLKDRSDDPVKAFSRGMTQRVTIARALMHDPELILADEPFAGLDNPSTQTLERLLGMLHRDGRTIVLVNHDIEQSLRLGQRAIVLHRGRVAIDEATSVLSVQRVLEEVCRP